METITKPRANFILWVNRNTNFVANLSIPKKYINTPYKDIVKFLQSHPLHYALTAIPRMYPDMLKEFWSTCEYHPSRNYISGSVCKGEYLIRVTIKGLRDTLKLPHYNEFDPLVTEAEFKRVLGICGDNFTTVEESKATNLRDKTIRSRLPAIWMYLSRTISRSLGIKVGNYTSSMERQIFHSLVTGTNIDYAELIFNELKKIVLEEPRNRYIPYPRFLSLFFHEAMGNNYTQADDLESTTPIVLGPQIFQKSVKNGDPNLTSAMRRTIKNPYEHLQSKSEADLSSSEADSSDSEPGSLSHCKSKSSSPSNSRNSTLRGISKVILPKTNPPPPPPPPPPPLPPPPPPPPSETSETSSSQLSKSPSRNKSAETKTIDKGQVPPAMVTAMTATLEPNQDRYFTPSPSHNHHSSPNNTQRDPPTDTSTILQAIMALTSKVDTISSKVDTFSSDVESAKTGMATAQTITTAQHNILIQELATLKSQIQNYASPQTPSSPPSHSSVHGLTSQVAALEAKVKAVHHTLHTLQDNTVTSDAKLTEDIDAIKTQHFCFSVQLESFKNLQEKVHTTAINTQTAVNNLNDLCVAVQTSLGNLSKAFLANVDNSNKTLESLEAQVEAAQGALSMVQTTVGMNNRLLDNLNEQVNISVKAATYQQSASPFSSDEDDSKTCRFKRKRG